jgi:hypothetical protein
LTQQVGGWDPQKEPAPLPWEANKQRLTIMGFSEAAANAANAAAAGGTATFTEHGCVSDGLHRRRAPI